MTWNTVVVLYDKRMHNQAVCLLNSDDRVVAVFRINPPQQDADAILCYLLPSGGSLRGMQCSVFPDVAGCPSADLIQGLLDEGVRVRITQPLLNKLFSTDKSESKRLGGRGKPISAPTANTVFLLSHGRCMFKGCSERLFNDLLTGKKGNYGYLAHIIASSPDGPRGCDELSHTLSDDPSNIMLLCDKHHRLIDKIAEREYNVGVLRQMKHDFEEAVNKYLDLLRYPNANSFFVFFKVNNQSHSQPTLQEVAACHSTCGWQHNGSPYTVMCNDTISDDKTTFFWKELAPQYISRAYAGIMQTAGDTPGLLFTIGPMAILIGLGAKIGNKFKLLPALRNRITEKWEVALESQPKDFIQTDFLEYSPGKHSDIILYIALTADPLEGYSEKAIDTNIKLSRVKVSITKQGNTVISNPKDGLQLQDIIMTLLHKFKNDKFEHVHIICCASNAACVYIGRAIEQYHPNITVYDFLTNESKEKVLQPVLDINPGNEQTLCVKSVVPPELLLDNLSSILHKGR